MRLSQDAKAEIACCEALLRWNDIELENIPIEEVIKVAANIRIIDVRGA